MACAGFAVKQSVVVRVFCVVGAHDGLLLINDFNGFINRRTRN